MDINNNGSGGFGEPSDPNNSGQNKGNVNNFPVHIYPEVIQEIIVNQHQFLNFPKPFSAVSVLHAISTAIGDTHRSVYKNHFPVFTHLFAALVGPPGTYKSQPIKAAYKPIEERDKEDHKTFKKEKSDYESQKIAFKKGEYIDDPVKPKETTRIVSDITVERVAALALENPRGFCQYSDELAGKLKSFNGYSSRGEQEQWLQIFDGTGFNIQRLGRESIRIESSCIGFLGTIQPGILMELVKDGRNENGFIWRLLYAYPSNLKLVRHSKQKIDTKYAVEWKEIIDSLMELKYDKDNEGNEVPNIVPFSEEAENLIIEWENKCADENEETDDKDLIEIQAKMRIYVCRFALILQVLRHVCGETDTWDTIELESAKRAIDLAEYFKANAVRVAEEVNGTTSPLENLPENKKVVYDRLPEKFTTAMAKEVLEKHNIESPELKMSERSLELWLKNGKRVFQKIKTGHYRKIA